MQLWACRFRAEQFYKPDFRGYSLRKGVVFEESLDIEDKSHRQDGADRDQEGLPRTGGGHGQPATSCPEPL